MPPLPSARERLIVALDLPAAQPALAAAERLATKVGMFKLGLELFVAEGPSIVHEFRRRFPAVDIFLDLKLHDIPNTMRGAIRGVRGMGVRFVTVHAGSGVDHLRACVDEAADAVEILAVTVLTSQDAQAGAEAGHTRDPQALVVARSTCAVKAGCAGVVCSGEELGAVVATAPALFRVVPGIRPAGAERSDQKRVMTPGAAITAGATHLVVGRPIVGASDPAAAADAIVGEIADALAG